MFQVNFLFFKLLFIRPYNYFLLHFYQVSLFRNIYQISGHYQLPLYHPLSEESYKWISNFLSELNRIDNNWLLCIAISSFSSLGNASLSHSMLFMPLIETNFWPNISANECLFSSDILWKPQNKLIWVNLLQYLIIKLIWKSSISGLLL